MGNSKTASAPEVLLTAADIRSLCSARTPVTDSAYRRQLGRMLAWRSTRLQECNPLGRYLIALCIRALEREAGAE